MSWAEEKTNKSFQGVHPVLIRKLRVVLSAMSTLGFPMVATDGVRTAEEQNKKFQEGRTLPGKKRTNADGYVILSNHQVKPDGFGHAVDCCFIDPNNPSRPTWDEDMPWQAYGACCKAVGLRWGIKIGQTLDKPHVELPYTV